MKINGPKFDVEILFIHCSLENLNNTKFKKKQLHKIRIFEFYVYLVASMLSLSMPAMSD